MAQTRTSRIRLDRAAVVSAAADLVNREGAGALTVGRLAQELGIQPPSLYNHVDGMEDLWRELSLRNTRALSEAITAAAVGRSGPEGVMALAQAYRAYVKDFPGLYQASLRASGNLSQPHQELRAAEEQTVRAVLALVESFGLAGEEAIHAVRALRSAVHGFATLEAAGGFGLPLDLDKSFRRLIKTIIRGMTRGKGQ